MISIPRFLLFLFCACLALPLRVAAQAGEDKPTPSVQLGKATPPTKVWAPQNTDPLIARTTVSMLTNFHYLHPVMDAKLSDKFLTTYLNTLDPQHIHFLQSDLDEFEQYRPKLGDMIAKDGDTRPAYLIFNRFMQRLEQRTAYATDLMKEGNFEFTSGEDMPLSRKTSPYPQDIAEARQLWRQRLRFEYLQERLSKESRGALAGLVLSQHNPVAVALMWRDFNDDIVKTLSKRYSRVQRNFRDWESDKVLEVYLTSLGHVCDPHSDYYDKTDLENFAIQMSNTLFGIGATLSLSDEGYTTIVALVPSGPADKSKKLKAGDRIVSVAQNTNEPVDVVDTPLNHVVDMIRGPKGTVVNLTIIPADAVDPSTRVNVRLVRDEINLVDQQAKGSIIELPGKGDAKPLRLGVIDLPSFYSTFQIMGARGRSQIKSPTIDVLRLLFKFRQEDVQGVILDLRHNGGGSLEEAVSLTGLFIKKGPVVQIRGSDGSQDLREDNDEDMPYKGPLIVLTSRFSASASEILAGALQDYGRALVVGDKSTHGKGSVQTMGQLAQYLFLTSGVYLPNGAALGALKYTTNKFYRISGSSTQLEGIQPDVILPSTYEYMELLGEKSLDNALPHDSIASVEHDKYNFVQPFLTELKTRSAARVATDQDYDYVREDIEQVKKIMGDKSISLNEQTRLKEADENELRQKRRERELKNRKWPDQRIYDITVKQSEDPGLPPPLVITNGVIKSTNLSRIGAGTSITGSIFEITNSGSQGGTFQANLPGTPNSSAAATNSASVGQVAATSPPKTPAPDDGDDDETKPKIFNPADLSPVERAPLIEAERILVDYISLMKADPSLTVAH